MLEKGKKVGEYVLLEKLGAGGFGDVWKAEKRTVLDVNHFALKFFRPKTDGVDFDKIGKELSVWKQLRGLPHIISVIELDRFEDYVYVVSDFADGGSLENWLKNNGGKASSESEAVQIALEILTGLENLHGKNFVHRDLKPDNILIMNGRHCLADFGISREIKTHSKATGTAGTMEYMPPEAFEKTPSVTPQTDIWAVGAILQRLLTGNLPYPQDEQPSLIAAILMSEPDEMPETVSQSLREIVKKSLQKNREDRFQSANEMREGLRDFLMRQKFVESQINSQAKTLILEDSDRTAKLEIAATQDSREIEAEKARQQKLEAKRQQSELLQVGQNLKETQKLEIKSRGLAFLWIQILGALIFVGILGYSIWKVNNPTTDANMLTNKIQTNSTNSKNTNSPMNQEIETPPPPRQISQPPNTIYFENSKQGLSDDLVKNFLGFSIYYPNDWAKNTSKDDFLDITKKSTDGLPVKQIIITRYESKGTFNQDKPNFAKLVEKTNKDLKAALPNFKVVGDGETTIQNGRWKAYEVKFENSGTIAKNGELTLYGRRLWIPVQRAGMKSGFVITLVATSLAPNVQSVENLMTDAELSQILETFEPSQTF